MTTKKLYNNLHLQCILYIHPTKKYNMVTYYKTNLTGSPGSPFCPGVPGGPGGPSGSGVGTGKVGGTGAVFCMVKVKIKCSRFAPLLTHSEDQENHNNIGVNKKINAHAHGHHTVLTYCHLCCT